MTAPGLWLTGCQGLSPPLPPTSRDKLGTEAELPSPAPLPPLLVLSDKGTGVLTRRLLKSREGQGPPAPLPLPGTANPPKSPCSDSVGGAPGPRLASPVFHGSSHKHSSSHASGSRNPSYTSSLQALGQPAPPVWKSPPPPHLAASSSSFSQVSSQPSPAREPFSDLTPSCWASPASVMPVMPD